MRLNLTVVIPFLLAIVFTVSIIFDVQTKKQAYKDQCVRDAELYISHNKLYSCISDKP